MTPLISITIAGIASLLLVAGAALWAMLWPVKRSDDGGYL